jgi:antimicrobial peptide system SdpA family protein
MAASPDVTKARRLGGFALTLIGLALVVCTYVVHVQLPPNAVQLPYEQSLRLGVQQFLPEGWAFFTRNPREPDMMAYVRDESGTWRLALRSPHSELRNVVGFARASRAQGVEIALLTGSLHKDDWRDCRSPVTECLERVPALTATNISPAHSLCGQVGLVRQPPVPWAWSESANRITMPGTVVRLEVSC